MLCRPLSFSCPLGCAQRSTTQTCGQRLLEHDATRTASLLTPLTKPPFQRMEPWRFPQFLLVPSMLNPLSVHCTCCYYSAGFFPFRNNLL